MCFIHWTESLAPGVRDLDRVRKCVRHSEKEEREEGERQEETDPGRPSKEVEDAGKRREEGAGRTPWPAIRPAGGRWSGQTMARRSAEPGTKFGVAFAGRGAARSSPCKGETK